MNARIAVRCGPENWSFPASVACFYRRKACLVKLEPDSNSVHVDVESVADPGRSNGRERHLSGTWTQLSTCTTVWDTETAHSWSNHSEDSGECGWSLGLSAMKTMRQPRLFVT